MIVGHKKQREFLKKSALNQGLAHAYLFSGPEQVGKRTVAVEFVRLLHCQEKNLKNRPCGQCPACQMVLKNTHPDALFLEPENSKKDIPIAQIREMIYRLSLKPFLSDWKTVIIDRADMMNAQSQSCLLKTLEEPQGDTVLVLLTSRPGRLFGTIRSRVQEIKLHPLSQKLIEDFLKQKKVSAVRARQIASLSLGRPGRALDFLKNPQRLKRERKKIGEFIEVLHSDLATRFQYANALTKKPLKPLFNAWLTYFREFLLFKAGSRKEIFFLPNFLQNVSLAKLKNIIENLETSNFLLSEKNVNKRLALEILMLNIKK